MIKIFNPIFKPKHLPVFLSSRMKESGKILFLRFQVLNGISVACLLDSFLILYAIRNGLSDASVAVLSSFIFLTMPFMIVGKVLVYRIGLARTFALGWFFRYLTAFILVTAPFAGAVSSQRAVSLIILAGGFGFAMFRSIGAVGSTPLEGEITEPGERGAFHSRLSARVNSTHLLTMLLIVIILRIVDDLWIYQLIIAAGCFVGIYASIIIARIPETDAPRQTAAKPLRESLAGIWRVPEARKLLFAWCAGLSAFTLVIPFMVIAVKNGYGATDFTAMGFMMAALLGALFSSAVNSFLSDRTGPRPLLIVYIAGIFAVALSWALAPASFLLIPAGASFFIAGFCRSGINMCLAHYFLNTVGKSARLGAIMIIHIVSGLATGISASVLGGGLIYILGSSEVSGMDLYRMYFRIIIPVIVMLALAVKRISPKDSWPVRELVSLLFSPRDAYALYILNRLKKIQTPENESRDLQKLGDIGSNLPEAQLREMLYSPRYSLRTEALRALGRIAFGKATEEAVLLELKNGEYTTAWIAAEISGIHSLKAAVPALRESLSSADHLLLAKSMVALARIQDKDSYSSIISIFETTKNPLVAIHGARAVAMIKDKNSLEYLLKKSMDSSLPDAVVDEILVAASGDTPSETAFYRFIQHYRRNKKYALDSIFFPELNETVFALRSRAFLDEIVSGDKPLVYFRKSLEKLAARADSPAAKAINNLLADNRGNFIRKKTLFCMAMILSSPEDSRGLGARVE